jgi:hypothetical protein
MIKQRFPEGWDEDRVQRLLADLDSRTEEQWVAADEAAASEHDDQVVVTVLDQERRLDAFNSPEERSIARDRCPTTAEAGRRSDAPPAIDRERTGLKGAALNGV